MSIDGIILDKIVKRINSSLPIRINKISSFSNTELCFSIVSNNKKTNMLISMHPEDSHIRLSNKTYTDFIEPNNFIMTLRKHLTNGIIYKIEQIEYDRYLHLYIKNLNELYDKHEYLLSIELMGKYSNIILIEAKCNIIIDAYKRIPPSEISKRIIMPNTKYEIIESQNKQSPFENPLIRLDEILVNQLQGFSKELEKEVRYRMNKDSFSKIINAIQKSDKLYINIDTNKYHIIPLTNISENNQELDLFEGLDNIYYKKNEKEKIKGITNDIYKIVSRNIKREKEKLKKLNIQLDSTNDFLLEKENADMLYMENNLEEKGKKEIKINNKIIKLDPKLSIKQNASKFYQKYNKKKKGKQYLQEQIETVNNNINYLNKVNEELNIANHIDVEFIKEELMENGYIRNVNKKKKQKTKINLYQINTLDHTFIFGKNSIQNNYLTFTYSKSNDMFFHAKQFHGSHVVVKGNSLDEKTIRFAANLAAYFSQGRYSSSVPVDYCLIKDVKKIKGNKLGLVSIQNYKTIYIDPDKIDETLIRSI